MRLVIDCNVIISAGLTDGPSRVALTIALGEHEVLTSAEIREEYRQVAARRKFSEPVRARLRSLVDGITVRTQDMEISTLVGPVNIRDPKDVIFVLTATAGHADAILTGDVRDFIESHCGGARVLSVREFLDLHG